MGMHWLYSRTFLCSFGSVFQSLVSYIWSRSSKVTDQSSVVSLLKSSHVLSHVSEAVDLPYSVRISITYKGRYVDLCSGHL